MKYETAAPVPRPDANRIALRAVRSILDAAQPFELSVEGIPVQVDVSRLPPEPWPSYKLEGLDEATDGPLPAAVRLTCFWEGGSTELLLSAEWWKTQGRYRHLIALRTTVASLNREIGWVSMALPLQDGAEGERVPVPAAFNSFARRDEETADASERPDFSRLKAAVERSGLPCLSPWRMEVCTIRLPEGEVEPSPREAFQRLVHLALLKLPFLVRGEQEGITGRPLFELGSLPSGAGDRSAEARRPRDEERNDERRGGVGPMPGGVRQYKKTFDALLGQLQERAHTVDEFRTLLRERYDVTGQSALHTYLSVLLGLGVTEQRDKRLELTDTGEEYLREPTPYALFGLLHNRFTGLLEILVIAKMNGRADTSIMRTLLPRMLGTNWKSDNQANFRRNWLLSLGATERDDDGDFLTPVGETFLTAHAPEVERIRDRIQEMRETPPPEEDVEEERGAEEEASGGKTSTSSKLAVPSGWDADQLDLTADLAASHTKGLELPRLLLEQACAALSSGKHLLLVGPPGTGKTELAAALVETARAEGYCAGAFTATASADWTTFDTIGGYALQRDSSLEVRPGVFLRALERRQWLVIDELNRADVDRAFGELMTVLAGRGTDTALMQADGRLISIGTEPGCTHRMPRTFRVIATMNTWDKTSLFRLSHAVQRRFALLHVDVPEDETYARLIELHASREGMDPPLPEGSLAPLKHLFSTRGMLAHRAIGPAVALDMVRYMRRRQSSGDGLAEAMAMFLFPQLEGLEQEGASRMLELLIASLAGWTSAEAVGRLRLRYQELFPHLTFKRT